MMMMMFITEGAEGRGKTNKKRKATKSKGRGLKRGLVARSCARLGRKDVVREIRSIDTMGRQFHKAALEDPEG